jgi:hypothetical protein
MLRQQEYYTRSVTRLLKRETVLTKDEEVFELILTYGK